MLSKLTKSTSSRPSKSSTGSASILQNSNLLRITIFYLFIAALLIEQSHSQMTFSDGWGKRSVMFKEMRRLAPSVASNEETNRLDKTMMNAALDRCHSAYSQSLVKLHEQIMNMYDSYQQCQDRVIAAGNSHDQQG